MHPRPWLTFLVIGTVSIIVMAFFALRLKPIMRDKTTDETITTITEPTVSFVNPSKGAENPKVTIVEFGDFQCVACKELSMNLEVVLKSFPNDLRVVWKDMPNESAHPMATFAAVAAHCADRQGKFWEYHDALYERQTFLSEDELSKIALELELNTEVFSKCIDSRDTLPIVRKDYDEGKALGILATPTFYIGEKSAVGAISVEDLMGLIRQSMLME